MCSFHAEIEQPLAQTGRGCRRHPMPAGVGVNPVADLGLLAGPVNVGTDRAQYREVGQRVVGSGRDQEVEAGFGTPLLGAELNKSTTLLRAVGVLHGCPTGNLGVLARRNEI